MKRLLLAGSTLACLAAGALATPALAGVPGNGLPALDASNLTQEAQYMMEGRRYCFYPGGWHGPGWYRCGFAWRRGLGWGGVYGWNGWDRGPRYGRWDDRRGPRRDFGRDMRRGGREMRGDADQDRGAGGRGFGNDRTGTVRGGGIGGPSAGGGSDGSGRSGLGGGRGPSGGGGGGGRSGGMGDGGMGGNPGGGRDQR